MHEPILDFLWIALAVFASAPLLADRRQRQPRVACREQEPAQGAGKRARGVQVR